MDPDQNVSDPGHCSVYLLGYTWGMVQFTPSRRLIRTSVWALSTFWSSSRISPSFSKLYFPHLTRLFNIWFHLWHLNFIYILFSIFLCPIWQLTKIFTLSNQNPLIRLRKSTDISHLTVALVLLSAFVGLLVCVRGWSFPEAGSWSLYQSLLPVERQWRRGRSRRCPPWSGWAPWLRSPAAQPNL